MINLRFLVQSFFSSVFIANDDWNALPTKVKDDLKNGISRKTAWKMHIQEFRKVPGGTLFLGLWYYTLEDAYPGLQR